MTCSLAACDLKLFWFPLLGCHTTFGSSVRLLTLRRAETHHRRCSSVREKLVSTTLFGCSIAVWNEGHVTVASFLRNSVGSSESELFFLSAPNNNLLIHFAFEKG